MARITRIKNFISFINEEEKDSYKFNELPPDARQKALEKNSGFNINHEWWDWICKEFIDEMEELGVSIDTDDIQFTGFQTGFHSQGDGASFTTSDIDTKIFMEKVLGIKSNEYYDDGSEIDQEDELQQLASDLRSMGFDNRERVGPEDITFSIDRTSHQHVHERSVEVNVDVEIPEHLLDADDKAFRIFASELDKKATEWQIEKCKELYSKLKEVYANLTSEEEIADSLVSNDYDFDLKGNII